MSSLFGQKHHCQHWKSMHHAMAEERSVVAEDRGFQVEHYEINLDILDIGSQQLSGVCRISAMTETALNEVLLDLQGLEISEVLLNGNSVSFLQNTNDFTFSLGETYEANTAFEVEVQYSGTPETALFGGFYFQQGYAYNIGVGIGVDPPNYGRVWFPCIDSFTDRATYNITVNCSAENRAYCSGVLISNTVENGVRTMSYDMNESIPTYLASVAVAPYTEIAWTHNGLNGDVPVILAAVPSDTSNLRSSFVNFQAVIDGFEEAFGPYRWDRIGFTMVPFGFGAMEHATNIAYPGFAIGGGTLQYEDLMAHEFAHHWFGDLVTCSTADDMWLNEGWASFCEFYFYELLYGKERYTEEVKASHFDVLNYAHINDGGNYPVGEVPFDYTYGSTVYQKGAHIAHTLRGYMGDELFFSCIRDYMEAFQFQDASSEDFRDFLTECSNTDMAPFFDGWVFQAGYPNFAIDSMSALGNNQYKLFIRQQLLRAENFLERVPIDVSSFNSNMERVDQQIMLDGPCSTAIIDLDFEPQLVILDFHEKLADAKIAEHRTFGSEELGFHVLGDSGLTINLSENSDSLFVYVENQMVAPDRIENSPLGTNLIISEKHYWHIDIGTKAGATYNAGARFRYNGTNNTNVGLQDDDLFTQLETNLYLMYRPNANAPWYPFPGQEVLTGPNPGDKIGQIATESLFSGDYAFAIDDPNREDVLENPPACDAATGIEDLNLSNKNSLINIYPNPSTGIFQLQVPEHFKGEFEISIYNLEGRTIFNETQAIETPIDLSGIEAGIYNISVRNETQAWSEKIVLQ